jgi:DNA-directed RNA polymerase subunit RPC12/RpoP
MPGKSAYRQDYTVACSCGASFTLDVRGFGKPRPCVKCGATITVAWGRDPNTRNTVPVAMVKKKAAPKASAGPSAPPGATVSGPPGPPPEFTVKALCGCGNSKRVPESKKNNPPRCAQCGKIMRIEDAPIDRPKGKIEKFERAKPSAPLLPLHLRAPTRVRIKKAAPFFDCACGERVLILAGAEGKPVQCLVCDRLHILEIESAPPPGPVAEPDAKPRDAAPAPDAKPRDAVPAPDAKPRDAVPAPDAKPRDAVPAPSRPLLLGEFQCKCGEIQPPRTSRTGKSFECKKCGRKGNVDIEKGADGKVTITPTFTSEPKPAAAPAPAAAPVPAPAAPSWTCTCGQTVEVHKVMAKSNPTCPACGRKILMEMLKIPGTTQTMIRPTFVDPAPKQSDGVVSFEELPPADISAPVPFADTAVFETTAGTAGGDAPPAVASDAQIALCECGAEILVSMRDIGQTIQCPACADVMTVELTLDPRTKKPILGIRTLGSLDDADWKLDDFA